MRRDHQHRLADVGVGLAILVVVGGLSAVIVASWWASYNSGRPTPTPMGAGVLFVAALPLLLVRWLWRLWRSHTGPSWWW
jgi:hypothetical protein